ncbi:uncharacterized protein TRAVEDRAFT_52986 [Trametes versicolor FP-101664 SS1]|uniref:uncharacterized protein n=1 Tax=Trametes versicolor (strain FP-101664) TaxID=717944 RepID=UPI00046218AA|nr:uncharacterized protein TRAVEDRAFT_52986 [Trametes versicolor FP-101664 SS1]EIW52542.1 hypothetical protein TRAVEDRAFT_52986 [Trametes versicolor FP-101664 SS1]
MTDHPNSWPPYYGLPPIKGVAMSTPFAAAKQEEELLQERRKWLELELLGTNALINACAPINKLPAEILVLVMQSVQESYGADPIGQTEWLPMLQVCRHWLALASTTPVLWRTLVAGTSLNYLRTGLARSRNATVTISHTYPLLAGEVIQLLTPHIRRLRQLTLVTMLKEDTAHVAALLRHPLPALERFDFSVVGLPLEDQDADIELASHCLPALRHAIIKGIDIRPSSILQQLTTLHLCNWTEEDRMPTLDTFTRILHSCINIEELHIKNVCCRDVDSPAATDIVRTAVSKLRWLHIDTDTRTAKHTLSVLSLPPTAHVTIRWYITDQTPAADFTLGFLAVMPDDRTGLLSLLSGLNTARVQLYHDERKLVTYADAPPDSEDSPGPTFTLSITNPDLTRRATPLLFQDVLSICALAPLEDLRIDTESYKIPLIDWRAALAPFAQLRKLAILGLGRGRPGDPPCPVISSLNPEFAPTGTSDEDRLVCPELRTLRVEGFDVHLQGILPGLLSMLAARKEVLGWKKALGELSLELDYHRTDEYFEQCKTLYTEFLGSLVENLVYERNLT